MKDKKEPIVLDLDIFIHLMTSAYREGFMTNVVISGNRKT